MLNPLSKTAHAFFPWVFDFWVTDSWLSLQFQGVSFFLRNGPQNQSVTPMTIIPLLHQCTYPAKQIILVAFELHRCVEALMTLPPRGLQSTSRPMKKVAAMVETSGSDLSWFLNVLKPTYAVYPTALGAAHLILLDKQGPWQSIAWTVREPLGLPEQHLLGNYHTLGTRIFI